MSFIQPGIFIEEIMDVSDIGAPCCHFTPAQMIGLAVAAQGVDFAAPKPAVRLRVLVRHLWGMPKPEPGLKWLWLERL